MKDTALVLFDFDLRIQDNPAFFYACRDHKNVLPLFILDEKNKSEIGEVSKWFLHYALKELAHELEEKYSLKLVLKKGDSLEVLKEIFGKEKIAAIYFNRQVEPDNIRLHEKIKKLAKENSLELFDFKAQTLFAPEEIKNKSGNYFKIFTPFWRECLRGADAILDPLPAPTKLLAPQSSKTTNDDLQLLPRKNWIKKLEKNWEFNPEKIRKNLKNFLEKKVQNYKIDRDIPALDGTSKISPYLNFGMISVREIFLLCKQTQANEGLTQFLNEIGWREFSHHALYHFPDLPKKSFRVEFDRFPWNENKAVLEKWQKGQTGYPMVDAGMRELWATGWMHNRVRMLVASFLTKHLLIDWRLGAAWFWDCLADANLANNSINWQWVVGSGAESSPYYRIFNPTLQGLRFDKDGEYVKKWIPELKKLPTKFIHEPWKADEKTLEYCGIELEKTYPKPIVNHEEARNLALMLYKNL